MRAIRSRDTAPELVVRSVVHALGYRFRLHKAELPGRPDLTFARRRKVIFVHGCFWHQHPTSKCNDSGAPRSNVTYWGAKLARNVERDAEHIAALRADGWSVLVVWDCETKDLAKLSKRLRKFLS